ncbi:bowman-birk serine protease inhibitor family protein (macronuclear) [Tetrahymena thermophila SB210]|uniref:Bowman-birk serine protease inhibitor family protein n=1 Tax=Tetrahymena thermophila (strain SB210) TaxID=312017 RepID=Q22MV7_TETTS|nr:bowman-birk serine protease inhibitor family protein [Tetrahymena thermophila SB210]EAR86683.2 bowman-birk serine protease inhibitor family protein [Tetrahymena thermophila SB210]|eukprot:XP_976913.2 bowman-birk serine protease inhibitor family protein [Tetrahymena thermophila SB210]
MSNIIFRISSLAVLLNIVLGDIVLLQEDLVHSLSSTGWSNYKTRTTLVALKETENGCLGAYDKDATSIQKTFGGSFPPHWSISFDLFVYQFGTWQNDEFASVSLDGIVLGSVFKMVISDIDLENLGYYNGGVKIFHINTTHTAPSALINIQHNLRQIVVLEWICFNDIRLWIDTCDETCASCNGPAPNQCTSCPAGATLNTGKCTCPAGQYGSNYQCVTCPAGTWADTNLNKCVPACVVGSNFCSICKDQRSCDQCSGGKVSYKGDCINSCPFFYDSNAGACQPLERSFQRGQTIYQGLDGIIDQASTTPFTFSFTKYHNLNQNFYVCSNGVRMLGGFDLTGSGNFIYYQSGTIPYHWKLRIKVKVIYIDTWDSEYFYLKVDGQTVLSDRKDQRDFSSNFCGTANRNTNDQIIEYDITVNHSGTSFILGFETNLDESLTNESFGISNLIAVIDLCPNQLCATCTDRICLTCVNGAFLDATNICVATCPGGTFGNILNGKCETCSPVCLTCSNSPRNCTACQPTRGHNAVLPDCACQSNEYDNLPNPTCKQCSYKCLTCTQVDSNCTTCSANRPNRPPSCNCDDGTFEQDNQNPVCGTCDSKCSTCSGQADHCLTCKGNRIRVPNCTCPEGTFDDGVSLNCIPCNPKCRTCSVTPDNCATCNSNREMPNCTCPRYKYDDGSLICKVCSYQCATCVGSANNCTSCAGNRLPQTPQCPCPPNYNDAGYANCVVCDPKCNTCSADSKDCVTCAANRRQNPPFCTCPIGTYENDRANCPSCSYKCSSCDRSDNNCIQCSHTTRINAPTCDCKDGYFDKGTIDCGVCPIKCVNCRSETECTICSTNRSNPPQCSCNDGFYEDSNRECRACHPNCNRCIGPGPNQCQTCAGNRIDFPTCKCPIGTYDDGNIACPRCNSACSSCSGPSVNDCASCSGNKIYDSSSNKCVCPKNTYDLGIGYFCAQCNVFCDGCQGNPNNCIKCAGGRTGFPFCNQCPDGTFDNGGLTCSRCNTNICSTCSQSPSSCTTCAPNRINPPQCTCLPGTFDNGISCETCDPICSSCNQQKQNCTQCIAGRSGAPYCGCNEGTYDDGVNIACQQCPNQCLTCSGSNSCTQCRGDRINLPSCQCPYGKFDDGVSEMCRDCHPKCGSCQGTSDNCTTCKGNRVNFPVCQCPDGYYETGDFICARCDKKCGSCSESPTHCLTCSGQKINPPDCSCPNQTYYDLVLNDCSRCFPTCQICTGKFPNQCLLCLPSFIMRDGMCQGEVGTYVDYESNSIKNCNFTCQECESKQDRCIKCDSSKKRILQNNSCICIEGYSENELKQCIPIVNPVQNRCILPNFGPGIYQDQSCECPDGQFLIESSGRCAACPSNDCKTCNSSSCITCHDGYELNAKGFCFKRVTDQSAQIVLFIFCGLAFCFVFSAGLAYFIKRQYKFFKIKIIPQANKNNSSNFLEASTVKFQEQQSLPIINIV